MLQVIFSLQCTSSGNFTTPLKWRVQNWSPAIALDRLASWMLRRHPFLFCSIFSMVLELHMDNQTGSRS